MLAFAGNSLLCRLALQNAGNDPNAFTTIRIVSGAIALWAIVKIRSLTQQSPPAPTRTGSASSKGSNVQDAEGEATQSTQARFLPAAGNWISAVALFTYAATFSIAYVSLPTATGALLLFSAVQATMIGFGLWSGERLRPVQVLGLVVSLGGLIGLLLPELAKPTFLGTLLMLSSGGAWGVYSILGKRRNATDTFDPISVTAGNFIRAALLAVVLKLVTWNAGWLTPEGWILAIASGAITSGLGYTIWYLALPSMKSTTAATVQLSVPAIASLGGIVFLSETISVRFALASAAILGGIALFIYQKRSSN